MLIPKILTSFITLITLLFLLSLIYSILDYLPKAQAVIELKIKEENPFSTHLCLVFFHSDEISNLIKKIIDREDVETSKHLLLMKLSYIFKDFGFEIEIDGESIKKGGLVYKDLYKCIFFYRGKEYEIKIKL